MIAFVVAGCASRPRIDWVSRVGQYTFDQAVTEMGPPAGSAKLSDGTTVAEWLSQRGYVHGFITSDSIGGYPYYNPVPPVGTYVTSRTPDQFIRLTFGPDGKLTSWKKVLK